MLVVSLVLLFLIRCRFPPDKSIAEEYFSPVLIIKKECNYAAYDWFVIGDFKMVGFLYR